LTIDESPTNIRKANSNKDISSIFLVKFYAIRRTIQTDIAHRIYKPLPPISGQDRT